MSEDAILTNPPIAPAPAAPINRLSIAHLLLWLTMTSVVLACERPMLEPAFLSNATDANSSNLRTKWRLTRVLSITVAPATGAGLATAVLVLWQAIQRRVSLLTQPGHWLLLFAAAQFAPYLVWLLSESTTWNPLRTLVACFAFLVPATVTLVATINSTQRRWQATFVLLMVGIGGNAMVYLALFVSQFVTPVGLRGSSLSALMTISWFVGMGAYACGLIASSRDLWLKERRDILHWAGCAALLALTMRAILSRVIWLI